MVCADEARPMVLGTVFGIEKMKVARVAMVIAIACASLLIETVEQEFVGYHARRTTVRSSLHAIEEGTGMPDAVVHELFFPDVDHLFCPSLLIGVDVCL